MNAVATAQVSVAGPIDMALAGERDVQAACGIMHVHGRRAGRPQTLGFDYATILAAELAELGTLAVEVARQRGIPVAGVSTSLAQAALLAVSQYLAAATADDPEPLPGGAGAGRFHSADGVAFELEALDPVVWQRFWRRIGVGDAILGRGWGPFVRRFATATCVLPPQLHRATAGEPILRLESVARETGMTLVRANPRRLEQLPPFTLGGAGGGVPAAGPADALPLSGLVVLESCRRVQGPMAGHLLRLLGARVLRIEPPGGDPLRGVPPMSGGISARFQALNWGKEGIEIDLGTADGREELLGLASAADVFVHNWAPGKAAQWSLTPAELARVNPRLVYAHASGWGAEPMADRPLGTDFVVQAYSGVPSTLMTVVDVFGGVVCAHGMVAALARGATRVDSSLLSAACRLNSRSHTRCPEPLTVPVCEDLATLAADPRFAPALRRDGCALVASPWEFR